MLKPPCESVVSGFVLGVRIVLSNKLKEERGLTQKQISEILGVSQPVVNQYLKKIDIQSKFSIFNEDIQNTAEKIFQAYLKGSTEEIILGLLCLTCKKLRTDGLLCEEHKKNSSVFTKFRPCSACRITDFSDLEELDHRRRLIGEVEVLSEYFIAQSKFSELIPAVGTQICIALPAAKALGDVVAIPGGIVAVKGRPIPVSRSAEFGGSKTTAGVLLMKRKLNIEVQMVVSIKNTARIRDILSKKGLKIMQTAAGDKNWANIFKERKKEAIEADAIADEGGIGLEPILYLFSFLNSNDLKQNISYLVSQV